MVSWGGLLAAINNRRFAEASHDSSAKVFGRPVREGSRESRFMNVWSRTIAVLVGSGLFVMGTLGTLGVIWES
ncbi:hypothetical protein [Actinoplanes sp. RD1]|uniref:hypothetical protein n=1 Tax=Actinoplanes sp. RD1 TaxID=3064538 RepID=UPI002741192B|nr:hypothetical protein [Actinoplanes sp. RD1]